MIECISIIVRRGKAYLATQAKAGPGTYVGVEPVLVVDLTAETLTTALERIIEAGHPSIPEITREFWQQHKDPVLAATGVKSWNKLAKDSASYTIEWSPELITLYMSRLDQKGRFEADPNKMRYFPLSTSLPVVAEAIVADATSRPELKNKG